MDGSRERDQAVGRLLRQSLLTPRHAGTADSCLDAETLAAWLDGGLSGAALEMAQSHAAGCARCQSLVGALARIDQVVPQLQPERVSRRWLAWLVPLTAAAAAVVLWVAVPQDIGRRSPPPEVQQQAAKTKAQEPAPQAASPQAPANQEEKQSVQTSRPRRNDEPQRRAEVSRDAAKEDVAAAPRPSAGREVGLAQSADRSALAAGIEIVSPDPAIRWRIAGSLLQRSTDGGLHWEPLYTGIAAELTAGAAPSSSVCWVVGRGGVVLLTTDGSSWRRVSFPEATDLSAVQATDAYAASVSTADGRTFRTTDGGLTWVPAPHERAEGAEGIPLLLCDSPRLSCSLRLLCDLDECLLQESSAAPF